VPESLIPTIIQFPILAIFVWFTFEMQKRYQASIDDSRKLEADERNKRDEQWRTFLLDQRKAQSDGMEALSVRMEQMANVLSAINKNVDNVMIKFSSHDQRAEDISRAIAAHDASTRKQSSQ